MNIFVPNIFNERNLPEIQDKNTLCLAFIHAKESVSSKKIVRLLNKTVNEMNTRTCEHETKICAKIN